MMYATTRKGNKQVSVIGSTVRVDDRTFHFDNAQHAEAAYRKVLKYRQL